MKPFKTLLLTGLLGLTLVLPSQAQFSGGIAGAYSYSLMPTGIVASTVTNFVLPGAASPTVTAIDTYNNKSLTFSLSVQATAATGNTILAFVRSPDAVQWESKPFLVMTVPNTAASNQCVQTNIFLDSCRFIAPWYLTNSDASANATNISLKIGVKPGY